MYFTGTFDEEQAKNVFKSDFPRMAAMICRSFLYLDGVKSAMKLFDAKICADFLDLRDFALGSIVDYEEELKKMMNG